MKINAALTQAAMGVQRGLASAQQHASQIAAIGTGGDDLSSITETSAGLLQDRVQVQASARVVETVDDMIGSLFDARA